MWNYSDLNTVLKEILPGDNPCKCHRSRYLGYILPATIAGVQGTVQVLVHMHMHPNGCDEYDHLCPSGANPSRRFLLALTASRTAGFHLDRYRLNMIFSNPHKYGVKTH